VFVLRAFSTELVAADLFVGTWKLNSAKNKSKIGMPPKQQTVAFSEEGSDLHVMVRGLGGWQGDFHPFHPHLRVESGKIIEPAV
jgi:hypothetical protein